MTTDTGATKAVKRDGFLLTVQVEDGALSMAGGRSDFDVEKALGRNLGCFAGWCVPMFRYRTQSR